MLVALGKLIGLGAHVADYAQTQALGIVALAVVLAGESYKTRCQADKADAERAVVDDRLDAVGGTEHVGAVPQLGHHQRELLCQGGLLEVKSVAELAGGYLEHTVELAEKAGDSLLAVLDAHALDGDAHDIDGGETEVAATDGSLLAVAVFKHAGAAAHRGHLVEIALRVVGRPLLVLIEGGVEIDKVGEEAAGGHLAGQLVEVVVGVVGQVAHAALFLPYLYGEDGCGAVAHALVCRVEQLAYDASALGRGIGAVVDGAEDHLVAPARVDGVHIVDKRLHGLVHTRHGAVDGMLHHPLAAGKAVEVAVLEVFEHHLIHVGEVFAVEALEIFDLLDKGCAHVRRQIEVKGGDGLAAVHLVLSGLERYAGDDRRCLDAAGRARLAVAGNEAVLKYTVERMLHTGQALGGIVVFVVDMDVTVAHGVAGLLCEQVVVDKWLGGLRGKFHHHACRRVGVHVGVLAGDIGALCLDDFMKHVAGLGAARDAALVAVCDIALGHLLAGAVHKLELDQILDILDGHALRAARADAVGDFVDERLILAKLCGEHGLADGSFDFLFVIAYYASVALYYGLYHGVCAGE